MVFALDLFQPQTVVSDDILELAKGSEPGKLYLPYFDFDVDNTGLPENRAARCSKVQGCFPIHGIGGNVDEQATGALLQCSLPIGQRKTENHSQSQPSRASISVDKCASQCRCLLGHDVVVSYNSKSSSLHLLRWLPRFNASV